MQYNGNDQEWLAILNPVSGGKKAAKDKGKILAALDSMNIQYQLIETEFTGHAIELTQAAIHKGYRKIMAIGGDGTVNEVLNGIYRQQIVKPIEVAFAFIPVGTGNDWVRTIGIPTDYQGAAKTIKTGNYFFQDVGVAEFYNEGKLQKHYFANIAGLGYDAFVANYTNKKSMGGKNKGKFTYLLNMLKCLMKYKPSKVKVTIDQQTVIEENIFSMCVSICKYNGNGMMQSPYAVPDDGLLDVTLFHQPSKAEIMLNTSKLYDGSFVDKKFVSLHQAATVKIEAEPAILLETDGEVIGETPVEFKLIHHGFKIISNIKNRQI
jgi:YegS/Rv2252/BmrU family lipid kinase